MASETTTEPADAPPAPGQLARRGGAAVLGAAVVNVVVTAVATAAGVAPDLEHLSYGPVVLFTVVGAVGAVGVYAVLSRLVDDADRWFTVVAALVLVVSVVPDFTVIPDEPGGSLAAGAVLAAMHVTTAAIAVAALTGRVPVGR